MMITFIALIALTPQIQKGFPLETVRPKWVTDRWASTDPFGSAWNGYAEALSEHHGYFEKGGWAQKATKAIEALGNKPDAKALYKAAASYLTAVDLDWRFELNPPPFALENRANSSKLWGTLFRAWVGFKGNPGSKEFCRVGFAVCGSSDGPAFDASPMPEALLKAFPNDRLVVSSLVWYTAAPGKPRTASWMNWMLDQAKRLPSLPGFRPQDYLTVAHAYSVHHWVQDTLSDAIGYRDNVILFRKNVPPDLGNRMDGALRGVNKHIQELGGK